MSHAALFEKLANEVVLTNAGFLHGDLSLQRCPNALSLKQSQADLRESTKKGTRNFMASLVVNAATGDDRSATLCSVTRYSIVVMLFD